MEEKSSWWQNNWVAIGVGAIVLVIVVTLIITGYWFDWTGFDGYNKVTITHSISGINAGTVTRTEEYQPGKALWDWLQLLIIPVVLAIGGYLFTYTINRNERKAADRHNQTEREIAQDNQNEAALQEYIDKMSELLLHEKLRESQPEDEVRTIARVRTLTTLSRLDEVRKGSVLQFLYESRLIEKDKPIIDLGGADLSRANLKYAILSRTNLRSANLSNTDLREASLTGADLTCANLEGADLRHAHLTRADLSQANLRNADLSNTSLRGNTIFSDADLKEVNMRYSDLKGVNLSGADLSGADLREAYLRYTDLSYTDLSRAILYKAKLWEANLESAQLEGADLRKAEFFTGGDGRESAKLEDALLEKANLEGAKITNEQLKQSRTLKGAIMPDGSIHL